MIKMTFCHLKPKDIQFTVIYNVRLVKVNDIFAQKNALNN